ncbi:hypothetical protein PVAP13_1KG265111 [Panicum virgatum]|uniref:Uncharacterized protein n=1 Tax=Panicum virgatum TaxID=38727 RepID=A0A8T0XX48_PANVG|nr:hypothetical protein PVAP13_1KG265111 [Panicum virgatum]
MACASRIGAESPRGDPRKKKPARAAGTEPSWAVQEKSRGFPAPRPRKPRGPAGDSVRGGLVSISITTGGDAAGEAEEMDGPRGRRPRRDSGHGELQLCRFSSGKGLPLEESVTITHRPIGSSSVGSCG